MVPLVPQIPSCFQPFVRAGPQYVAGAIGVAGRQAAEVTIEEVVAEPTAEEEQQPYIRPTIVGSIEESITAARAFIARYAAESDASPHPVVPNEVAECAASDQTFDAPSEVNESYSASFVEPTAEGYTAWASAAEGEAAVAVEQPGSSKAIGVQVAFAAVQATTKAEECIEVEPLIAVAKGYIAAGVAEVSSFEADTSADLGEHTGAAGVKRNRLAATGASGIVEEPSFVVKADIDTARRLSCQHPHGYLWLCLSHQL